MNFNQFYKDVELRIVDTITSLWANGNKEFQDYIKYILKSETLLAKPVFQNMFPWAPSNKIFGDLTDMFTPEFITKLDKIKNSDFRFPKDRKPYIHQVESWISTLKDNKSILVTTGTGSGKTECFMLPVLHDIFVNSPNSQGINAIFLYPLNALIGSQKKRMHSWCEALGNINYAIYNGNTKNTAPVNKQDKSYPEIISRLGIRETPPQILFTNPTMLEYLLVRDSDSQILNKSKGKLRWILLDEAHTLTGSKATEMALLIRRVVDAFGTEIENIRFAITSATVGIGEDEKLKLFMSDLCGINTSKINIIKGGRFLPDIPNDYFNDKFDNPDHAKDLRSIFFNNICVNTEEIGSIIHDPILNNQLEFIDNISELKHNKDSVLPVRGHFFTRTLNGLYSCTNPKCNIHNPHFPNGFIGTLSSNAKKNCICGYPMLELVSCKTCSSHFLEGEKKENFVIQKSNESNDFFIVDNIEYEEDEDNNNSSSNLKNANNGRLLLAKKSISNPFKTRNLTNITINIDNSYTDDPSHLYEVVNQNACPYCESNIEKLHHYRLSASLLNRVLSDIILDQTNVSTQITQDTLYKGRKYISFTDSRQGTAKISALINIDSETSWLRSQVFHSLCNKVKINKPPVISDDEREAILIELDNIKFRLKSASLPFQQQILQQQINQYNTLLNSTSINLKDYRINWSNLITSLLNNPDFKKLFNNNIGYGTSIDNENYLKSLLYKEFSRRLPRERSLANLGMVNLVFPEVDNLITPQIAIDLGLEDADWKSLINISLDYVIRHKFHYIISDQINVFSTVKHRSYSIFPSEDNINTGLKWPKFDRKNIRPNRLAFLICAGLGYHDSSMISKDVENQINDLMLNIWSVLRSKFLTNLGQNNGYRLDLESKSSFELANNLWLCPVKKQLLNNVFKGYSPWITGDFTPNNISNYKILKQLNFPLFPYPFNLDNDNKYNNNPTNQWFGINEEVLNLKQLGLWNSLHERYINFKELYLAGEHSAQQEPARLEQLEARFQDNKINILSCSTTMEMGVDIGGISAVAMSNVPPSAANYLQRSGRAGRRNENKSITFTICAPNPIGNNVISNPKWALENIIPPPMISFNSRSVVERHLNALLLGKFIQIKLLGITITETISGFFFNNNDGQTTYSEEFQNWFLAIDNEIGIKNSISSLVRETPLKNFQIISLINIVQSAFQTINNIIIERDADFKNSLTEMISAGFNQSSPAYRAINFQHIQFLNKNLLTFLAEQGFLPSGGIPIGVVEFNNVLKTDLYANKVNNRKLPAFHITRALVEYAPGSEVVIDGWTYISSGITLKSNMGNQSVRNLLRHCTSCGHEMIVQNNPIQLNNVCPNCENNTLTGIKRETAFSEIIEPVGFAVDLYSDRSRVINEVTKRNFIEPLLINVDPWLESSSPVIDYRDSNDKAEILYYNPGNGNGFSVCLTCGKASTNPGDLINHYRLRGGKDDDQNSGMCSGNTNQYAIRDNVLLVGRLQTDFFEFRCKNETGKLINDKATLYSLAQTISKNLALKLGIEEQEIDFGIKAYGDYCSVFLFDTAKGGAGYVSKCAFYLEEICKDSYRQLNNCDCVSACTKCLIDRRTQYNIEDLDRRKALEWLKRMIDKKIPEEISTLLVNNPSRLVVDLKDDLAKLLVKKQLSEIWLFVNHEIENWEPTSLNILNNMKLSQVKINLVFCAIPKTLTLQQRLNLFQIKEWASLYYSDDYAIGDLNSIAKIKLIDNNFIDYFSTEFNSTLNSSWGQASNSFIYKQESTEIAYIPYELKFDDLSGNIFQVKIKAKNKNIVTHELFNEFFQELEITERNRLAKVLNNKKVIFVYSDNFLRNPFSCILLLQFVDKIRERFSLDIDKLKIMIKPIEYNYQQQTYYIKDQFQDDELRNDFINNISSDIEISKVEVITSKHLPHWRNLSILIDEIEVVSISPDAGVEHGWFANNKYIKTVDIDINQPMQMTQVLNKEILYTLKFNE